MSGIAVSRLMELQNRLELLKREAESAVSNVRRMVRRGNSVLSFQESIQDVECFLRSYPLSGTEIDYLINSLVKMNCELEITLSRKPDFCKALSSYESNDSAFYEVDVLEMRGSCETCAKEKRNISTNTDNVCVGNIHEYDRESIIKLYDVDEDSILEMKHLQGDSPCEFWLGYYSDQELHSHLAELKRKLQLGELHRITSTPVIGQYIIAYVGSVSRGCILSVTSREIVAVDIDTAVLKLLNLHDIWEIGDCLSSFPPQAIRCKLWDIESVAGWNKYLSTLFGNCLSKCNLVVTVKAIIPGIVPTFVVDVDAHDNTSLDVNMSKWINSFVCPAIEKIQVYCLSGATEESIFRDLDPFVMFKEDSSDSDSSISEQNVTGPQDANMNSEIKELRESVPIAHDDFINSNSSIENVDVTPVRDSSELIFSSTCTKSEITPENNESINNFVIENSHVNQVNDVSSAEHNLKHDFQGQCEKEVTKSGGPFFKSSVVKCFLEKDKTLGMSFLRGNDPWSFFLRYVSLHEIVELKKKIAERADSELLIPFPDVPKVGDFAIGKCDQEYYRVRVIGLSEQNENIVVIDIDSGEVNLVSMTDLWVLEEVFSLPPARAISCSLWNVPKDPSYWSVELSNLFRNVMTRGACCVNVKDVEYISGNWKHVVHIKIYADYVFDVSEWMMNFVFPSLKTIEQCHKSGGDIDDAVSKLDPSKVFSEEKNDTQDFVINQTSPKVTKPPLVLKPQTSEHKISCLQGSQILPKVKNFLASALRHDVLNFKKRSQIIEPKKKYYVFMSSVVSPSEFYIHVILEENSFIDKMHLELSRYCSNEMIYFKTKKEARQIIPECCAVRFNKQWLRGRILDWFDDSSEDVSICLVDYGVQTTVIFQCIQPLRSDFYEYPIFAERCTLAFLSPPNNNDRWPEKSLQTFSSLLNYDTVYEIYIVNCLESGIFSVFLFCVETENVWCINDHLVEEGCALSEINGCALSEINGCAVSDVNETENSHVVYYPIIDSGIDETISDSDSNDDYHQCKNVEIISYFDNNTAGLPDVGEELLVVMTEIVNMSMFYAVPAKIQYEGIFQSTHEVLMKMNKKISSAVQSGQLKLSKQIREGTIALARYSKDKNWYRARVLASPADNGYVEVFFVDYGNVDKVHKFYIREIRKEFCELPFQAMRFFLDSIDITKLREKNAREIAQTLLSSLVDRFEVLVKVTRVVNEDIEVIVLHEGRDIGAEMMNLYYAQCG